MTDLEALKKFSAEHDPAAFRTLVVNNQAMVVSLCRRKLGHEQDVEDAVQEVFLKLARNAGSVRQNPSAWLYACASSTCIDQIRRQSRRRARERAVATHEFTNDERPQSEELYQTLDACISELPENERNALVRHFFAGHSQTDIAEQTGATQSGVSRQIGRALTKLRARLDARDVTISSTGLAAFLSSASAEAEVSLPLTERLVSSGISAAASRRHPILISLCLGTAVIIVGMVAAWWSGSERQTVAKATTIVSDRDLIAADPSQVDTLDLGDSLVTDEGLAVIGRFANLRQLELCNTSVSLTGLSHLPELSHLEELSLIGVDVDDRVVNVLAKITSLRILHVAGSGISNQGVLNLKQLRPDLTIE
jgi:RNA polymerase sigma factor (sigma-70 family)